MLLTERQVVEKNMMRKSPVYLSPDELYDLDQARLALRGDLGLAVDRGRIVRESLSIIIADLEAKGDQSIIARRLRASLKPTCSLGAR